MKTCGAGPWPLGLACILEVLHLRLTPTTPEAIIQVDQRPIMHLLSIWITQVELLTASSIHQAATHCSHINCQYRPIQAATAT